jgi:hypothetical protein
MTLAKVGWGGIQTYQRRLLTLFLDTLKLRKLQEKVKNEATVDVHGCMNLCIHIAEVSLTRLPVVYVLFISAWASRCSFYFLG